MKKILLCGNPNTGKTTLFNSLSKSIEKASNWHGVTVKVKEKAIKIGEESFVLCDLPGIYSLNGVSEEEKISSEFILNNKDEIIVCVTDANNLKRNLLLAMELKNLSKRLIIAVNMANEVKCLDEEKLSLNLGVPVVCVDARKNKSVAKLKSAILKINSEKSELKHDFNDIFSNSLNQRLDKFEDYVKDKFGYIDKLLEKSGYDKIGNYGQTKLDKIFLNRFLAPIVFLFVMGLVFFITFGFVGEWVAGLFNNLMQGIGEEIVGFLEKKTNNIGFIKFIEEGVLSGVLTIVGFLPQILLMSFCLNLLEDFGYLSRVSVMFDGFLKKVGLTGKSVFSLVMGFGCTTSAVITTRNLGLKEEREKTVLCLPFISCSAKLPIYSVICSVFFAKYKAFFTFLLYIFAILLMIAFSYIYSKIKKAQKQNFFMLELPKFRVPKLKKVFLDSFSVVKSFVLKVGFSILLSSVIVYLLFNLNFKLQSCIDKTESIIYILSDKLSFILAPIGLNLAGVMVALNSGLIAKEMVVSALVIANSCDISMLGESLLNPNSVVHFTSLTAIVFLVFVLLYSPCISSLISMKKEFGFKVMFKSFVIQTVIAYIISLIVYLTGLFIQKGLWWAMVLFLIFIAILFVVVLKLINKKNIKIKTKPICNDCKGEECGDFCLQRK